MLLAIDIGNTNIHNGIFRKRSLKRTFRIPTCVENLTSHYIRNLKPDLNDIEKVIVVSVVPERLRKVEGALKKVLGKKILIVGRDVDSGVKNIYKNPRQVGQDRLCNALAAYRLYGGEAIIVDFGTAITIDVINSSREYLGGVIAPGVEISINALSEKASLLPKVNIKKPRAILGKETKESMVSGAVYGFSSLCDGIVRRLKKRYCKNGQVIATGGMSRLIGPYCETVDKIDPDLTLKGLSLIAGD
ncbi:MAG: type III pantothenate kinase [Candidatus Omnitrophica bacterium]|nr:type III pantothenate kinase [Candidatus Omnitrophota bacterium]